MPSPTAVTVVLIGDEREQLERWATAQEDGQTLKLRARIILAAAEGRSNTDIAGGLHVHRNTVILWRRRFTELRLDGLTDEPRSGRPRKANGERVGHALLEAGLSPSSAVAKHDAAEGFRRRLLDGLADSIRDRGLQGTQVSDIVRNARTSKSRFYECFTDKESCFAELIDEWTQEILSIVELAIDPEAAWQDQLDMAVDAYLSALESDPVLAVAVSRELPALGARGARLQEEEIDRYARLLVEVTGWPTMRRSGVEPVTLDVALMLVGGIAELVDRAMRERRPLEPVAATIKSVMHRVVGPRVAISGK